MKRTARLAILTVLHSLLLPMTARASGPVPDFRVSRIGIREEQATDVIRMKVEQTFQSEFRTGQGSVAPGLPNNNTNTWHYELLYTHRFTVNEQWHLRLGLDLDRRDFGDNRSDAPTAIQCYAGILALEYSPTRQTRLFIASHPGIYLVHDIRTAVFDIPTAIGGIFPLVDDKVYLAAGVSLSMLRSYPVLPIGGIIWHINDVWDLEACLPNPRIYFKASETLQCWAGGELTGGAFRTDGATKAALNEATVTYFEIRVGAGVIYTGWKGLAVDFGCGWAFERKFDMHRAHAVIATEGAPFVQLTLSAAF